MPCLGCYVTFIIIMSKTVALFKDDALSGNERKHYFYLKEHFPVPEHFIYPNMALQAILSSDIRSDLKPEVEFIESLDLMFGERDFFDTSSVDFCILSTKDYFPIAAFEIDGETHLRKAQVKKDEFKNSLFEKANLPLKRLKVRRDQSENEKRQQLFRSVEEVKGMLQLPKAGTRSNPHLRNILNGDMKDYYERLSAVFKGSEYIIFPQMAMQSIFDDTSIKSLSEYAQKKICRTSLVDFCIISTPEFKPVVAFGIGSDDLKRNIFDQFGVPLLNLPAPER